MNNHSHNFTGYFNTTCVVSIPDYEMPAISGSPCDTLTSIATYIVTNSAKLFVYYQTDWKKLFLNAEHLQGKQATLKIYDSMGKLVNNAESKTTSGYFTMDVNCNGFAKGMYVVSVETAKEKIQQKVILY